MAVEGSPARFRNPNWTPGTAGTFAVAIGVSSYPHLRDGTGPPADENFGLSQLHNSALTAHDVFDWLASDYHADVPLAECWFLASPVPSEIRVEPDLARAAEATFQNCCEAIRQWYAAMKALAPEAADASRSLFFFSGHGIEMLPGRQILLPSDFLEPPVESADESLSTESLVNGVGSLGVHHHLFFIDACRNDIAKLRELNLRGSTILSQSASTRLHPQLVAPILYATATGAPAFQPRNQGHRTRFGTALLSGLRGHDGIALQQMPDEAQVWVYALQAMVKRRVNELIAASGASVTQRVVFGGSYIDDDMVATVPVGPTLAPTGPTLDDLVAEVEQAGDRQHEYDLLPGSFRQHRDGLGQVELVAEVGSMRLRLQPLGAERATEFDARVVPTMEWATTTADRSAESFALNLPPVDGAWRLRADGFDPVGRAWDVVLPADQEAAVFVVEVGLETWIPPPDTPEQFAGGGSLGNAKVPSELTVGLSLGNTGWLRQAAFLSRLRDDIGLGPSRMLAEQTLLEIMSDKLTDPLAATIAADVLLDIRSTELPESWLENLTSYFPSRPDGPVLLAELRHRRGDIDGWLRALDVVIERGLPYLTTNIGRLARQVTDLRLSDDPRATDLGDRLRPRVDDVVQRFVPSSTFITFVRSGASPEPGLPDIGTPI
ncbi:MAG: caspase family protein [Acidimicrobiales bacterium]